MPRFRESVLDRAMEIARDIATNVAPVSAALTKRLLNSFLTFPDAVRAGEIDMELFNWTVAQPDAGDLKRPDNEILLTIFLRHDQSRPLGELNAQLEKQGFYKAFPPEGIEVVSWNVVMGIGQIITLRLPASRIREVNRVLEDTAWGPYRTEFYPTYDYKSVGMAEHDKAVQR